MPEFFCMKRTSLHYVIRGQSSLVSTTEMSATRRKILCEQFSRGSQVNIFDNQLFFCKMADYLPCMYKFPLQKHAN